MAKRKVEYFLILTVILLLAGCRTSDFVHTESYIGPDKVVTTRMKEFLQYTGFSIGRPDDSNWFFYHSQQDPERAHFIYVDESNDLRLDAFVTISSTDLVIGEIDIAQFLSEFKEGDAKTNTIALLSQEPCKLDGIEGIHYKFGMASGQEHQTLRNLMGRGIFVLHPNLKHAKTMKSGLISVLFVYSNNTAVDYKINNLINNFIQSIVIEDSPGVRSQRSL